MDLKNVCLLKALCAWELHWRTSHGSLVFSPLALIFLGAERVFPRRDKSQILIQRRRWLDGAVRGLSKAQQPPLVTWTPGETQMASMGVHMLLQLQAAGEARLSWISGLGLWSSRCWRA